MSKPAYQLTYVVETHQFPKKAWNHADDPFGTAGLLVTPIEVQLDYQDTHKVEDKLLEKREYTTIALDSTPSTPMIIPTASTSDMDLINYQAAASSATPHPTFHRTMSCLKPTATITSPSNINIDHTPPSYIPLTPAEATCKSAFYALYPALAIESLSCPLCFHIPNRAKRFPCCNYIICSPCARQWLRPSRSIASQSLSDSAPPQSSCPFCRSEVSMSMAMNGLPDAVGMQMANPETGTPTPGTLDISEFCLEAQWSLSGSTSYAISDSVLLRSALLQPTLVHTESTTGSVYSGGIESHIESVSTDMGRLDTETETEIRIDQESDQPSQERSIRLIAENLVQTIRNSFRRSYRRNTLGGTEETDSLLPQQNSPESISSTRTRWSSRSVGEFLYRIATTYWSGLLALVLVLTIVIMAVILNVQLLAQ
ncbi:hypothetical protein BATDEDRAFT_30781 [Batrachochytrium dendrobatidis JAM81]|uniref:RING-type domain-containing protein n=1 Tax=Batrachochytrium dendrobatidis (strain JAM81 / FGSC 10211) TaxID=684364 RepID=F4PCG6_BATDJ|nr:uncharacterized protein BATDEDRAFT_30781 [Batrachochytrium dendrobatidis JAM81]EGF77085.1 hypothetical protein BATDEDRAFT_30781 [Batrachochytrium dendrobatidis JAM81]|eukprot:XP_006682214.1 hypothetical protein BATDEDRAFT_30781 [Batrachochytrium dendrobatidis JAM81]